MKTFVPLIKPNKKKKRKNFFKIYQKNIRYLFSIFKEFWESIFKTLLKRGASSKDYLSSLMLFTKLMSRNSKISMKMTKTVVLTFTQKPMKTDLTLYGVYNRNF